MKIEIWIFFLRYDENSVANSAQFMFTDIPEKFQMRLPQFL